MVGDIVLVENGMEIPSDGLMILGAEVTADESAMTGIINYHFKIYYFNQIEVTVFKLDL